MQSDAGFSLPSNAVAEYDFMIHSFAASTDIIIALSSANSDLLKPFGIEPSASVARLTPSVALHGVIITLWMEQAQGHKLEPEQEQEQEQEQVQEQEQEQEQEKEQGGHIASASPPPPPQPAPARPSPKLPADPNKGECS
jgi:hypothetical protein